MQKRYLWLLAGALAFGVGVPRPSHAGPPTKMVFGDTFKHEDVGAPDAPGNTKIDGTGAAAKLTLTGTGNDVWAGTEQMQFAYTTLPGDGGVTAKLLSVSGGDSDGWSKTGTMLRESDAADGPHLAAYLAYCNANTADPHGDSNSGGRNLEPSFRIDDSNTMERGKDNVTLSNISLDSHEYYRRLDGGPIWMRTQRRGQVYTHLASDDGVHWLQISQDVIPIDPKKAIVAGVYSTEHKDADTTPYVGTFDNVQVDDGVIVTGPANVETTPGAGGVLLTYGAVDNAISYNIYRWGPKDHAPAKINKDPVPNGWYIDDQGLTNGTDYLYMVTAVLKDGTETSGTRMALAEPQVPLVLANAPFMNYDIGTETPGSTKLDGTTLTVSGSGNDIWNQVDGFRFVATPMVGNYSITAKMLEKPANGPANAATWVKAGVMIRESLEPEARNALMMATTGNGVVFHWRRGARLQNGDMQGDNPSEAEAVGTDDSSSTYPVFLRVTRNGDTVQGFQSKDGTTFTRVGDDVNIPSLSLFTYAGFAVTAHNDRLQGIAKFDASSLTIQ
jgi:hypothetical protein